MLAPGRLFLFDRNFLGGDLVAEILAADAHVLMRVTSAIAPPDLGWRPDGSYESCLRAAEGPIPGPRRRTRRGRPAGDPGAVVP